MSLSAGVPKAPCFILVLFLALAALPLREARGAQSSPVGPSPTLPPVADEPSDPVPGLKIEPNLPQFAMGPVVSAGFHTQLLGAGVMGWLYVAHALHVSYRYELGAVSIGRKLAVAHDAELFVGVPIDESHGEATTTLALAAEDGMGFADDPYRRSRVLTHSLTLVEAGGLLSPLVYSRCDEACQDDLFADPPPSVRHLGTLGAGVRYRYFFHADSPRLFTSARQSLELSAHVLALGLGAPDGDIYGYPSQDRITPWPVGIRASIAGVPTIWFPVYFQLDGGVLPASAEPFISAKMAYFFY